MNKKAKSLIFSSLLSILTLSGCTSIHELVPNADPIPAANSSWKQMVGTWKFEKCRGKEIQPEIVVFDKIQNGKQTGLRINNWNQAKQSVSARPDQSYTVFPVELSRGKHQSKDLSDNNPIEWDSTHTIADNKVIISYQWNPGKGDSRGHWLGSGVGNYFISDQGQLVLKRQGVTYMPNNTDNPGLVSWESHCYYSRSTTPNKLISLNPSQKDENTKTN